MRRRNDANEGGFVLITSLVFLVVLTSVVIYSIRGATIYERSASNSRNHSQAFQAAEYALLQAQKRLVSPPADDASSNCVGGLCGMAAATSSFTTASYWLASSSNKDKSCAVNGECNVGGSAAKAEVPNVGEQPRYIMKKLTPGTDSQGSCDYYEVTSFGTGGSAESAVVLRAIVKTCMS